MTDDATPPVGLDAEADAGGPAEVEPEPAPIGVLGGGRTPVATGARGARRGRRGRLFLVLGLLALPFVVVAALVLVPARPDRRPGDPVVVTIPKGEGVGGDRRPARAPGRDRLVARVLGLRRASRARHGFQAGRYQLREDLGVRSAIDVLERGPSQHYTTLALPPGLTFAEIAARIGALPGRSAARATELATTGAVRSKFEPAGTNSLEGLTWPDSYSIEDHETEADILHTIVDRLRPSRDRGSGSRPRPIRTGP